MTAPNFAYPKNASSAISKAKTLVIFCTEGNLRKSWTGKLLGKALAARFEHLVTDLKSGPTGKSVESVAAVGPRRLVVAALPDKVSRHNAPSRIEAIFAAAKRASAGGGATILFLMDETEHLLGALTGFARTCPLYSRKSEQTPSKGAVEILAASPTGSLIEVAEEVRIAVDTVRWAARMVDTPTRELTTADFVTQAKSSLRGIKNVTQKVIVGKDLLAHGLEGIHAVGQCAMVPPRLLILDYRPRGARRTVALVGKGVVYDTGGLSLKPTGSMSGMKGDMGGAAAVVGAFRRLALQQSRTRIIALAALAENAIGANAFRNDDILRLHSGHTVEINNTDAEGRLLLGDAVSYVARTYEPALIINAATLTGAQLVATGYRHAAIVSNREGLEALAVECGLRTGDMTFPLPFAPEFYQSEFNSVVADMKNSVGNRSNAQSSCAAQFVYNHIDDLNIPWLHVDMAGPAFRDERGTGYGVNLLTDLVEELRDAHLHA